METETPQETATPQTEVPAPKPDKDYEQMFLDQRRRAEKAEEEAKELKERLQEQTFVPSNNEDDSSLRNELAEIKQKIAKQEVIETYPLLKESWRDFEAFQENPDNKGMNLKTAAKAFLVEKGILEPQRKGLEKTTGGTRQPIPSGMNPEEVAKLRTTNYEKYRKMVKNGEIKIS